MSSPYGPYQQFVQGSPYSAYPAYVVPPQDPQYQGRYTEPGSQTYTETRQDGRTVYNIFIAEARSYQTVQGPVHGIQWIQMETTYKRPTHIPPAGPEFHQAFSQHGPINNKDAQRIEDDWQREQEKRAKKEEKESAKRMKEWDKERREREKAEEKELRKEERELRGRQRAGHGVSFPTYATKGRSRSRSYRRDSGGEEELTRRMAEVAMEGGIRSRRGSFAAPRAQSNATDSYTRTRRLSQAQYPTVASHATGSGTVYGGPPEAARSYSNRNSPYTRGGILPAGNIPVYPHGHILAGQPVPGLTGTTDYRAPSPRVDSTYRRPSSARRSERQLEIPECFGRSINGALSYTYFDPILITSNLDALENVLLPLPLVLQPHDVRHIDWNRCLEDLADAWFSTGAWHRDTMIKKSARLVVQLIDAWNASFFTLRGVELILFRGRQRQTGPQAGRYDAFLGVESTSDEDSDTISSVSDDEDNEERHGYYESTRYGTDPWMINSRNARRAYKAAKKLKEKKRQRELERKSQQSRVYSLYLSCIDDGQPPRTRRPPPSPRTYTAVFPTYQ